MRGMRETSYKRTPCRVIYIGVVIPSIKERGTGVFPQRYIDCMDLAKQQCDGQGEKNPVSWAPHSGRKEEQQECILSRRPLLVRV